MSTPIDVTLEIDNVYEDETIQTTVETQVPPPPDSVYEYDLADWVDEHIFRHTGAGRSGDAGYFVTVAKSSNPDLIPVGTEYEFC